MYTARRTKSNVKNGAVYLTIEYTNGTDTFSEEIWANSGADPAWDQNRVANRLKELNELTALASTYKPKSYDGTWDLAKPPESALWAQDVIKLKQMKASVDMGLLEATDPDFVAQKKKVKDGFKKEFINSVQLF